jgi:hypothetical protein
VIVGIHVLKWQPKCRERAIDSIKAAIIVNDDGRHPNLRLRTPFIGHSLLAQRLRRIVVGRLRWVAIVEALID